MDLNYRLKVFRMKMTFNPWDVSSAAVFLKYCCPECDYQVWQYRFWSFQGRDTKVESFLGLKINCSQIKSLNFANWSNGELSKSDKIWLSKSIFYVKNHLNLSVFFIEEYEFKSTIFVCDIFLLASIFKSLCFLKWCPIFDSLPLL